MPEYNVGAATADVDNQIRYVMNNIAEIRRVVFFVGAGISVSSGYPLWSDASQAALNLAQDKGLSFGATAYAHEKLNKCSYYELFEVLRSELTEPVYYDIIRTVFAGNNHASEIHRLLVNIRARGIITTNFDECLVSACVLERGAPPLDDIQYAMASDDYYVVKPHGSIQRPNSMVLTTTDWKRVEMDGRFHHFIAQTVSNNQLFFLGYGLSDPDFSHAWDHILRERVFRAPAIFCCGAGSLDSNRISDSARGMYLLLSFRTTAPIGSYLAS